MIDNTITSKECTGCKMCGDLCPKKAISFKDGKDGFWKPEVDYDKCIKCNLCIKQCPALSNTVQLDRMSEYTVYEIYHKDALIRYKSTSGGAFAGLAETIIEAGGVVAGCTYSEDFKSAYHRVARTLKELEPLIGSKYFQDDMSGVYQMVKKELDKKYPVLFAGTPCQVAGIYHFLNKDYDNLYTASFICKGINSPKAYRAYLDELEKKYHSKVSDVHFKHKKQGWTNLGVLITFKNGMTDYTNKQNNPYINGFVKGNLYIRSCCHHCKFKSLPLISDITYGDFWGIKTSQENLQNGVSVTFINSQKGQRLLELSKDKLIYKKHDHFDVNTNRHLVTSTQQNLEGQEAFFERLDLEEPFSQIVWSILHTTAKRQQQKFYLFNLVRKLKLMVGLKDHL